MAHYQQTRGQQPVDLSAEDEISASNYLKIPKVKMPGHMRRLRKCVSASWLPNPVRGLVAEGNMIADALSF
jgi:hypothetical protein